MTIDAEDNLPPENVREALDRHLVRVIESRLKTDTEENEGLDRVRSFFKFGGGRSCRVVTDLELNATLVSLPREVFQGERPELQVQLYEHGG